VIAPPYSCYAWRDRDWRDLRERLTDLGSLGEELVEGLDGQSLRFLFAVVAPMAEDAARLARALETVVVNTALENGVELPPLPPVPPLSGGGS